MIYAELEKHETVAAKSRSADEPAGIAMNRLPKKLDAGKLHDYALKTLGSRAQSLGELREKLRRRAENTEDIDAVMTRLKESGYLNDRKYAESFASARLQNEGHGRMRVMRDLRQHRVAPKLAEQVIEQAFRETDENQLIEAYLARKYRGKPLGTFLSEEKNLAAVFRRLRYAGFSAGTTIKVLKRYAQKADELESLDLEEPDSGSANDS